MQYVPGTWRKEEAACDGMPVSVTNATVPWTVAGSEKLLSNPAESLK